MVRDVIFIFLQPWFFDTAAMFLFLFSIFRCCLHSQKKLWRRGGGCVFRTLLYVLWSKHSNRLYNCCQSESRCQWHFRLRQNEALRPPPSFFMAPPNTPPFPRRPFPPEGSLQSQKQSNFLSHVVARFLSFLVLIYFQFSFTFHFRHIFVANSDKSACEN